MLYQQANKREGEVSTYKYACCSWRLYIMSQMQSSSPSTCPSINLLFFDNGRTSPEKCRRLKGLLPKWSAFCWFSFCDLIKEIPGDMQCSNKTTKIYFLNSQFTINLQLPSVFHARLWHQYSIHTASFLYLSYIKTHCLPTCKAAYLWGVNLLC
jgi:hypothetical protein